MKQKGFTLIELLVVVAIIGILAAIGVLSFGGFQKGAKKNACKQNNKTICNYVRAEVHKCYLGENDIIKGNYKCSNMQNANANIAGEIMHATIAALKDDFKNPYGNVTPSVGETALMNAGWSNDKDLGYTSLWVMHASGCGANGCNTHYLQFRTCTETPCKNNSTPPGSTTEVCEVVIER